MKSKKIVIILSVILVAFCTFCGISRSNNRIFYNGQLDATKIKKITYVNGNEKIVFKNSDEAFSYIIELLSSKHISENNAVHMGYKKYKIILSNAFDRVTLYPDLLNWDFTLIQIGEEKPLSGRYDYIILTDEEKEKLKDIITRYENEHNIERYDWSITY